MKVRALQNDTVDQLCWRHYGKTAGVTEKVLEANPGPVSYTHLTLPTICSV